MRDFISWNGIEIIETTAVDPNTIICHPYTLVKLMDENPIRHFGRNETYRKDKLEGFFAPESEWSEETKKRYDEIQADKRQTELFPADSPTL